MTIFNDQTRTPDEEAEMKLLKEGVAKAKAQIQEGREPSTEEPEEKPKPKRRKKR